MKIVHGKIKQKQDEIEIKNLRIVSCRKFSMNQLKDSKLIPDFWQDK